MKTRKIRLSQLKVQSFVTDLRPAAQLTVQGGQTDDNTFVLLSLEDCKDTVDPYVPGSGDQYCLEEPSIPG